MVSNNSSTMNEKEAASYVGMSVSFLRKDRSEGAFAKRTLGPRWAKLGRRVVYLKCDLDDWLETNLVRR